MRHSRQVEIAAPAARVWAVLADVERWPSWTPTVTSLEVVEAAGSGGAPPVREGTRVRITQPGVRPATYTVTEVVDGRRFTWEARGPGLLRRADHELEASGERSTTVTVAFALEGPVGRLMSALAASTVRRMVDTEADALRRRVEGEAAGQAS